MKKQQIKKDEHLALDMETDLPLQEKNRQIPYFPP